MQKLFSTSNSAKDFSKKNSDLFPNAPTKCPFGNCAMPVKLKKHGFYQRFFISKGFSGYIYIKRYKCPICGRTVSMLPVFCFTKIQYCAIDIMNIFFDAYLNGASPGAATKRIKAELPANTQSIDRSYIIRYRKKLIQKRALIQYAVNMISPGFTLAGNTPENQTWFKLLLEQVKKMSSTEEFLLDYWNKTGETLVNSKNMIA